MKNKYFSWCIIALVFIAFVALILARVKAEEGWLGFWGGIIGSALGILGAFLILKEQVNYDSVALKKQIDEEREQSRRQQIDNTFFNLLSMHNEQINSLKEKDKFKEIYKSMEKSLQSTMNDSCHIYTYGNKDIESELNKLKQQFEEYIEKNENKILIQHKQNYVDYWKKNHKELTFFWVADPILDRIADAIVAVKLIENIVVTDIEGERDLQNSIFSKLNKLDDYMRKFEFEKTELWTDLYNHILEYKTDNFNLIDNKLRKKLVEEVLNEFYSELGSYFRLFHRIIKYINDNFEDDKEISIKNNYLGFLRASVNEEEMLVIFYNAAYTKRGQGLLNELQKTTFFGTEEDIKNNQHFDTDELYWKNDDIGIMLNQENSMND